MKVKLLTTISLFTYQIGLSQTEKLLNGKVYSQNSYLKDVEVINKTAKTSVRTNASGEFSILVQAKDSLIFFSKDYFFKRLKVTQEDINQNNLTVNMILKPEELNEVVIEAIKSEHIGSTRQSTNEIKTAKLFNPLDEYTKINDGSMKFAPKLAIPIDRRSKKKETNELDFKKLVNATCPLDFFTKDLKLNPDEKDLFIEFCDADPRSKKLLENKNILSTMDFLYSKNEEFKKLKMDVKN